MALGVSVFPLQNSSFLAGMIENDTGFLYTACARHFAARTCFMFRLEDAANE